MSDQDVHQAIAIRLDLLEQQLKQLGFWSAYPPDAEAFNSTVPFFADTMNMGQWLQFVFIERVRAVVVQRGPLPGPCAVRPMAEEWLREQAGDHAALLELLGELDALLTRGAIGMRSVH